MQKTHHTSGHHEPHACPMWILNAVFAALLILTVATVYTATQIDLGSYNLLLAMGIALLKATLVALYFMHLWWDSLFNAVALVAGGAFLALFITFAIMDTYQYAPNVEPLGSVLTPEMIEQTAFKGAAHDVAHAPDHAASEGVTTPTSGDHE